jgi:hypothetical protein
MTRTISFITATVGAALLFAVPAYGDNWGADKAQPAGEQVRVSPDLADRAIAAEQIRLERMLDRREEALAVSIQNRVEPVDRERALGTKNELTLSSDFYADGFAQALQSRDSRPEPVRDDRFRIDPNSTPSVTATSSGTEIEWGQIGIGFGVGLVLALGLYLAMRFTRIRPLAH